MIPILFWYDYLGIHPAWGTILYVLKMPPGNGPLKENIGKWPIPGGGPFSMCSRCHQKMGHLGGIWEGSGGQGGAQGARGHLEGKCAKTIVFFCRKWRDRPFRVDGSDPTLTISAACAQKCADAYPGQTPSTTHPSSKTIRQNPYSVNTVWEKINKI